MFKVIQWLLIGGWVVFIPTSLLGQSKSLPQLGQQEREAIASELILPYKRILDEEGEPAHSLECFLELISYIDPEWVIDFIDHKKNDQVKDDFVRAVRVILIVNKPLNAESEKKLVDLFHYCCGFGYFSSAYTLDAMPAESIDRKRALIQAALKRQSRPGAFFNLADKAILVQQLRKLQLAFPEELDVKVKQYLKSGQANRDFQNLKKDVMDRMVNVRNYRIAAAQEFGWENMARQLMKIYPEFGKSIRVRPSVKEILCDKSTTRSEKEQLLQKHYMPKGIIKDRYDSFFLANIYARFAPLNPRLATECLDKAADPSARIWGKVLIAGMMGKKLPGFGRAQLAKAYRDFPLPASGQRGIGTTTKAKLLGLRFVKHCYPQQLGECLQIVKSELEEIIDFGNYNPVLGESIPILAQYDPNYAKKLFAKIDRMTMNSREAPSFVLALAVMDPHRIPLEIEQLPSDHYYFHHECVERVVGFLFDKKSKPNYRLLIDHPPFTCPKDLEKKIFGKD